MKPIKSSNIDGVDYDAGKERLTVKFKGGRSYHYDAVSSGVYADFLRAESAGKFFSSNIKGKFFSPEERSK